MRFIIFLSFILFTALPAPAFADTPPVPKSKKTSVPALQKQVKEIKRELGSTKDRLVKIGKSIQKNEKELLTLENKIDDLELEQLKIQQDLKTDQKSISRLVLALQRIKRVPPEALIAKPGAPLKTAQSAMLMSDIIPALNKQASALKENLASLDTITADLEAKKSKAVASAAKLKKEEIQLSSLVEKRQKLFAKTSRDLETQQKNAKIISKRAKNVKDLVKRLDDDDIKRAKVTNAAMPPASTPMPVPGKAQLPISGIIRLGYNQPDAFGAPSKGLEIEARSGSLIVVPMGGKVRFAGHFKNYGNMVIIEHKKGYHSLIAGFEKIDTVVGQSVSAGEPLGRLQRTNNKNKKKKPTLYYELRHNGKAINPRKKFTNLT